MTCLALEFNHMHNVIALSAVSVDVGNYSFDCFQWFSYELELV